MFPLDITFLRQMTAFHGAMMLGFVRLLFIGIALRQKPLC